MASLTFGTDATGTPRPGTGDVSAMIWAFVLIAIMSVVGFSGAWVITTVLIAAP